MKELHIIIKDPYVDDSNPLRWKSAGYKFLSDSGEWYGEVVWLPRGTDGQALKNVIKELVNLALIADEEVSKNGGKS